VPMGQLTVLAASADRQALVPMAAGYLILMSALALGLRRRYRSRATQAEHGQPAGPGLAGSRPGGGWAAQAWHVTGTVVGGYLLLMAVVVAYYYAVARVGPGFLQSAVTGTALLIGLAVPVFAAASWLAERLRRRRGGRAGYPPVPAGLLPRREATTARHLLIGYLAWAVLFGALFAWEGLALARVTGIPSLSDVVRVIMRYPPGRWALFALWLWAGWRVFVRRWQFLLRA
jgi:Family of unknown function (DUF6256)/Family of unknown function (DUF6186)